MVANGTLTESASPCKEYYLNPYVHKSSSYLWDTTDVWKKLNQAGDTAWDYMVIMSVEVLYTNIDLHNDLRAIHKFLSDRGGLIPLTGFIVRHD